MSLRNTSTGLRNGRVDFLNSTGIRHYQKTTPQQADEGDVVEQSWSSGFCPVFWVAAHSPSSGNIGIQMHGIDDTDVRMLFDQFLQRQAHVFLVCAKGFTPVRSDQHQAGIVVGNAGQRRVLPGMRQHAESAQSVDDGVAS